MRTLEQRMMEKCVVCGDCLLWRGALSTVNSAPSIHYEGRTRNARVALWESRGRVVPKGHAILPTKCNEPDCVAWGHLSAVNYRCRPKSIAAKLAITKTQRAASPVTEEIAAQIRTCEEKLSAWAERLGVTETTVSAIRHSRRWAPIVTPWKGLQA